MTSKHYKWQAKWQVNDEKTTAIHETGLVVTMTNEGIASHKDNDVRDALAVKNGHNAAAMVDRLKREGSNLLTGRAKIYPPR